jgi:hypothetical protein
MKLIFKTIREAIKSFFYVAQKGFFCKKRSELAKKLYHGAKDELIKKGEWKGWKRWGLQSYAMTASYEILKSVARGWVAFYKVGDFVNVQIRNFALDGFDFEPIRGLCCRFREDDEIKSFRIDNLAYGY